MLVIPKSARAIAFFLLSCVPLIAYGAPDIALPGVEVSFSNGKSSGAETASALKVVLGLTLLALAPGIVIAMTSFTRIVIVFAMLRHALGLQDTPPNTVLVSLALFLTLFIMAPVIERIDTDAVQPLSANKISTSEAIKRGAVPLKDFMIRQTRESDLLLMADIANRHPPQSIEEVSFVQLVPAFMLSELKSAFQIGFVLFLPFLIIDLVVSSVLMALGMMMMPPTAISMPFKILLFVMIDGWSLIVRAVAGSFI